MTAPGEALARSYFHRAVREDRLAHAYLLWGPESEERDRRAFQLATSLVCQEGPQEDRGPCGHCRPCREVAAGSHAGFLGAAQDSVHIDIEDIRLLSEKLAIAYERRRVVFIPRLERLTPPAANAFLKILEEPGGQTVYLLTTGRPSNIIPTILSRCHQLPFFVDAGPAQDIDFSEVDALLADPAALADIDLGDLLKPFPGQDKRQRLRAFLTHLLQQAAVRLGELSARGEGQATIFRRLGHEEVLDVAEMILERSEDLQWNVNVDLILETVAFRLRRMY